MSAALTEIAGSSDVFEAGFVTYSNDMKAELLKVSHDVLETFGAVSIATAWAMAQGALLNSHAHVAVAITGIAGPGGGTEQKPVGTVVFARAERGASPDKIVADMRHFDNDDAVACGFRPRCVRSNCCCPIRPARKAARRASRTRRSSCAAPCRTSAPPAFRTAGS